MSNVQVEQKIYEMPPREGFSIAHFLTVADMERSARFYETVFGARVLSRRNVVPRIYSATKYRIPNMHV